MNPTGARKCCLTWGCKTTLVHDAVEIAYAVPRLFFTCHLIFLLISNKMHMSDRHKKVSISRDAGLKKSTHLKVTQCYFMSGSLFQQIGMRKYLNFDAFALRLPLHMQCPRDKCSLKDCVHLFIPYAVGP